MKRPGEATHVAIPIESMKKLADYFWDTPMPRRQSDPYVEILGSGVPISLPQPTPTLAPAPSPPPQAPEDGAGTE
jgi:hypothetical protein